MQPTNNQTQKIVEYLRKNMKKGYKLDGLYYALMKQGYSRTSINHALEIIKKQRVQEKREPEKPKITYESYENIGTKEPEKPKKSFFKKLFRK